MVDLNRRGFIRSLFSIGSIGAASSSEAQVQAKGKSVFLWCDLHSGHVGFPTGLDAPAIRPGSIAKLIAAASLVEDGFNTNLQFECTGTYKVSGVKELGEVHCQFAHGRLDLRRALAFSCNCFFAQATRSLTTRAFLAKARALGLASPVAGRSSGLFPAVESETKPSLPYVLGLAADFKPNCLQLMRLAGLIAIGPGERLPVLHSSENFELKDREKPLAVALTRKSAELLRSSMRLSVQEGTSSKLDPQDKMQIAAKTGTTDHGKKFQSQIIGFFPYDKPRNAFCLFSPAGTSVDAAVPEASNLILSTSW